MFFDEIESFEYCISCFGFGFAWGFGFHRFFYMDPIFISDIVTSDRLDKLAMKSDPIMISQIIILLN